MPPPMPPIDAGSWGVSEKIWDTENPKATYFRAFWVNMVLLKGGGGGPGRNRTRNLAVMSGQL